MPAVSAGPPPPPLVPALHLKRHPCLCPCPAAWAGALSGTCPRPASTAGRSARAAPTSRWRPTRAAQLAAVLRGEAAAAQLLRPDTSSEETGDTTALYPLLWLLRGDLCASQPLHLREVLGDDSGSLAWGSQWVACNASLTATRLSRHPAQQQQQ